MISQSATSIIAVQFKHIKHKVYPNSLLVLDSKPLSSLLDNGPLLERVCNRLDTSKPGVGDYHAVCSYYGIDSFQVTAVYEKHDGGPSKALLEHLAASHEQLTVAEFARVLRKIAKRGDIAKILEEYDNQ